jgi:hypothetical protein
MFTELQAHSEPTDIQQQYATTLAAELRGAALLIPTPANRHEQYANPLSVQHTCPTVLIPTPVNNHNPQPFSTS